MVTKIGYSESSLDNSAFYIRKADGILVTYSIEDRIGFREMERVCNQIRMLTDEEKLMVLCGTKCDADNFGSRWVPKSDGEELAKELKIPFYEASAMMEINESDPWYALLREIKKDKKRRAQEKRRS